MVAADDEEDLDLPHHQATKKFKHNIAERRRTSRLNSLFEELSQLVASRADLFSDTANGHSKADVLITSVSCLRHCFSTIDQLKDDGEREPDPQQRERSLVDLRSALEMMTRHRRLISEARPTLP